MQALEGTEAHIGLANGEAWKLIKLDQAGIGRVWRHVLGVAAPDHRLPHFPVNQHHRSFLECTPLRSFQQTWMPLLIEQTAQE